MRTLRAPRVALALGAPGSVLAQDRGTPEGHAPAHEVSPAAPYAGGDGRAIEALSGEAVADLRAGRGMGLAPSADRRAWTEAILGAMREGAVALGEETVAEEAALDGLSGAGTITPETLAAATARTCA